VISQHAVADIERLVLNEQAHDLPVRDVDDRLVALREAVAGFGVGHRAQLVEAREIGARHAERLTFVEVAADADMAVRECKDRLRLGKRIEVERCLAHDPRLDRERGVPNPQELRQVVHDDVCSMVR